MKHARVAMKVILLLSLPLLLGACSKKAARPQHPVAQAQSAAGGAKETGLVPAAGSSPAGTIRLAPVSPGNAAAASTPTQPASTAAGRTLTGHDRLIAMLGGNRVFPSDYAIGPLQPAMPRGTEAGSILHVVESFFTSLAAGKIDTELVAPQWRNELVRELSSPRSDGDLPSTVRVGLLTIEQGRAHAAIRMEKGAGRAAGEIYLERVDGTWYISDIQADFSQLAKPFVRSQLFDPAEWKSLLKE